MFCECQTKVHYTCPRYTATVILFWESLAISLFSYLCMRMCCLSVCLTDNGWQTMAETVSFLSMFIILLSYPFSLLILLSITSWLICFRLLRQNTAKLRLCGWGKQHFNNWDNNVFFHPNVSVYIAQPVLPHIDIWYSYFNGCCSSETDNETSVSPQSLTLCLWYKHI